MHVIAADRAGPTQEVTTLRVRKRTGTQGDTLIAWGLAVLAADVVNDDVTVRATPEAFEIDLELAPDDLAQACREYIPTDAVRLPWLACRAMGRVPARDDIYQVDRDAVRGGWERVRARGQQPDASGDAPATSTEEPLALKYPLLQVLTNPGPQWNGYNSMVEQAAVFWTADGAAALLGLYADPGVDDIDAALDAALMRLGLSSADARRRNPPGFLVPGANKGPTMRVERNGTVTGQTAALDWMMADRGDLSTAELYLAYVGYFNVAVVQTHKGGRVVSVPAPRRAVVPRIVERLARVQPRAFPESPAAVAADAALAYAQAALDYHTEFVVEEHTRPAQLVLSGVHLAVYWMPSGNTYAPQHVTFVPLPSWLLPLYRSAGRDGARDTLTRHRQQVRNVGYAESGEARAAIEAYRAALSGDALDWLRVMPAWYRAVLAEKFVGGWTVDEIERIAVAQQPELKDIIHDPAFEAITGAMQRVTVQAHYARQGRQRGEPPLGADRPGSPLSPQYDLVGALQEAAARHPDEFLRELCDFVAAYNREAMTRERRLVRREDLEQIIEWVRTDKRGLVPAALIAFGVSPRRRAVEQLEQEGAADEPQLPATGGAVTDK